MWSPVSYRLSVRQGKDRRSTNCATQPTLAPRRSDAKLRTGCRIVYKIMAVVSFKHQQTATLVNVSRHSQTPICMRNLSRRHDDWWPVSGTRNWPAHSSVAQWSTHSCAMCSAAWLALEAGFEARSWRVRLPPKNYFKNYSYAHDKQEHNSVQEKRVWQCPL